MNKMKAATMRKIRYYTRLMFRGRMQMKIGKELLPSQMLLLIQREMAKEIGAQWISDFGGESVKFRMRRKIQKWRRRLIFHGRIRMNNNVIL
jgi:hypothetical protein